MFSQSREIDSAARVSLPRGIFFDLCILKLSYCSLASCFISFNFAQWAWQGLLFKKLCASFAFLCCLALVSYVYLGSMSDYNEWAWQGRGVANTSAACATLLLFLLVFFLLLQHSSLCICATLIELNSCEELPDNLKWKCEHQLALQVSRHFFLFISYFGDFSTLSLCVDTENALLAFLSNIARTNRQCKHGLVS